MTINQYYVDPAIAANSGTGTSGDPFGDLQYALNTVSARASGNADQFNIKAGTAEILAAVLSLATYGTPTTSAPLILRGYTSTANDGGIGEIDANGGAAIPSASIILKDLYIHNGGSSTLVTMTLHMDNCKVANTSGSGIVATSGSVMGCEITDCGTGLNVASAGVFAYGNYFKAGGVRAFTNAVNISGSGGGIIRSIFSMGSSGTAIRATNNRFRIVNNSILASGSTGDGIVVNSAAFVVGAVITGNLIEGFSGTGGGGMNLGSTDHPARFAGNACYNNETDYENIGVATDLDNIDNESLGASPFTKSGSDTFANRFVYFAPANTGNVYGGAIQ